MAQPSIRQVVSGQVNWDSTVDSVTVIASQATAGDWIVCFHEMDFGAAEQSTSPTGSDGLAWLPLFTLSGAAGNNLTVKAWAAYVPNTASREVTVTHTDHYSASGGGGGAGHPGRRP